MKDTDFFDWVRSQASDARQEGASVTAGSTTLRWLDLTDAETLATLAEGLEPSAGSLVFFSDEWDERKAQCQTFIRARLGCFDRRLGARECSVREVSRAEARDFLEENHIQGANKLSVICFGLFKSKELLGVMSLGRHSRQIAGERIVLDRLCFKGGVQVVGGASKMLQQAVGWAKGEGYREILSFSDNRWTDGAVYQKMGFVLEKTWKPDYSYVRGAERFSKQSQKKDASGCPESVTEREWAQLQGFTRIYDAGKKRWVLNLWPGEHETWRDQNSKKCAEQHQKGTFRHSHIRGYFRSVKNGGSIYFGSSYELRALFMLEVDPTVSGFRRCDAFKGTEGWRNPDLWVNFVDGRSEIWEIKPQALLSNPAVQAQILESVRFANVKGVPFRLWTEQDSGLRGEREIIAWAREHIATSGRDPRYRDREREARGKIRKRYYEKHIANDKVEVWCDFCQKTHTALRLTHDKNIERNGKYICERLGGHLAGQKPKDHLKRTNPYAADGKKQCTRCNAILVIDGNFDMRKASWDGRSALCKGCISKVNAEKYLLKKAGKH